MPTGIVKWFNPAKGYGFIQPEVGGPDVFVHISAVQQAGLQQLNDGQRVSFDIEPDRRGKNQPSTSRRSDQAAHHPASAMPHRFAIGQPVEYFAADARIGGAGLYTIIRPATRGCRRLSVPHPAHSRWRAASCPRGPAPPPECPDVAGAAAIEPARTS